jgi:hypothetical protein
MIRTLTLEIDYRAVADEASLHEAVKHPAGIMVHWRNQVF